MRNMQQRSGMYRTQPSKVVDGKKIRTSITAASKKEAMMAAELWRAETREYCELSIQQAIDAYIEMRRAVCSPTTLRGYLSMAKTAYRPIGHIPVFSLKQADIQHLVAVWAAKGASPKTIKNRHGLLTATIQQFRPDMMIRTTLPIRTAPDLYIPSDKEIRAVLKAAKGTDLHLPILLAAFGPMRRGEISALDASDIDGATVHVRRAYALSPGREWVLKGPKTKAGDRYITYPDFVAELFPETGPVCKLMPDDITREFEKIFKRTDLHPFRFHDLRHFCASRLHALGIPDAFIQERGGWSSDVFKSVYRHILTDTKTDINTQINDYLERSFGKKAPRRHHKKSRMA